MPPFILQVQRQSQTALNDLIQARHALQLVSEAQVLECLQLKAQLSAQRQALQAICLNQ